MHFRVARLLASSSASLAPSTTPKPTLAPGESPIERWISSTFQLGLWGTIIYVAIVAAVTMVAITILKRQVRKKMTGNLRFFYHLIYVAVIIIAVVAVLSTVTPLKALGTAILASSGIAGVIVGLASQEALSNVFSGMSLALAKPFEVGEFIELPGTSPPISGTVLSISLRHTIIRDVSNREIVIPNSSLDHDIIERMRAHTEEAPAIVNNFLDVGVSYDSDVEKAMAIMAELCERQPQFVDSRTDEQKKDGARAVLVRVMALGDSSISLRATVPTRTLADGYQALSDLRLAVKKAFDAQGIVIPYPYQNVILHNNSAEPRDDASGGETVIEKS